MSDSNAQQQANPTAAGQLPPAGQYAPPAGGPPPQGAPPAGQYGAPAGAPPPAGQYAPPAGGPPPAGQYASPAGGPPPTGQYAPPAGSPPPQGQYAPPAGPPPPGQYPGYPPPGQPAYPGYPPQGQGYPPPAGYPAYPAYPGYPPQGGYAPPPGQPPAAPYYPQYGQQQQPYGGYAPQYGAYPPPPGAPGAPGTPGQGPPPGAPGQAPPPGAPGAPGQQPPFPPGGPPPAFGGYAPGYGAPPPGEAPGYPMAVGGVAAPTGLALWYLGVQIVDPNVPPAPLGATKVPGYNPEIDYTKLQRLAVTGIADEVKVAHILLGLNIAQRDALNDYFTAKTGKNLVGYLDSYVVSEPNAILRGIVLGPLGYDVELLKKALAGLGTDETLLTELIVNRPQDELRLLIAAYKKRYGKDLVDVVKADLSGKLERLFVMALNTQRAPDSVPVDHTQVATDVEVLVNAIKKKDELPFIEIFVNRSHPHLASVITAYGQRHKSLSKVVKKTFSGDIQRALLYILHGVKPKRDGQGIWRDAKMLEKTMAGLGTKDTQLIYRTLRAHWNPRRFEAIKTAYRNRYGKALESRIKGETSGPYRDVLIKVVKLSET